MEDIPREVAVVSSFIDDIKQQIDEIERSGKSAEKLANGVIKGDIAAARSKIEQGEAKGLDMTGARADLLFVQGSLAKAVVVAESGVGPDSDNLGIILIKGTLSRGKCGKWIKNGIQWLNESIALDPDPVAYMNLGLMYLSASRKEDAIQAFRAAEQSDDTSISVQATKEITRLEQKKGFCYVATACYGSYDHQDVVVLRRFRDEVLQSSYLGQSLVRAYYALSPGLAHHIGRVGWLSGAVRRLVLEPLVRRLDRAHPRR